MWIVDGYLCKTFKSIENPLSRGELMSMTLISGPSDDRADHVDDQFRNIKTNSSIQQKTVA